jgi:replicative superfamily II helicase
MSNEVKQEVYDQLTVLIREHKTTLIFVNTRRTAERAARHLSERIGKDAVTAHHGSLSREHRLDAEQRLKRGELRALVATASLELGIDIGDVDLVCQIGSPRSIAAFLQRVGRSGHAVGATPKGRLFPSSRDDLIESAALLDCVRRGELDTLELIDAPKDVLAQQIVAEVASGGAAGGGFGCRRASGCRRGRRREGIRSLEGRRVVRAGETRVAVPVALAARIRQGGPDARRRLCDAPWHARAHTCIATRSTAR